MSTQHDTKMNTQARWQGLPPKQGLYDPRFEHDACGVGFVAHLKGKKSAEIVQQGLQILINLDHRGACGCEPNTGDGAGILVQIPHKFFKKVTKSGKIKLPEPGLYGVAMIYLPKEDKPRRACERMFERIVREEGQHILGWRTVPTLNATLGPSAVATEPLVRQCFIARGTHEGNELALERKLYVIRKRAATEIQGSGIPGTHRWYVPSISCRTIVYKGMLTPGQVGEFYQDLRDPDFESALALVHSRFSTNTFPSWERSHPYRYIAHNGEINTLRGNVNWMHARQALFATEAFGPDIKKILPIINQNGSDSAMFDNCLELLYLSGRSLPHAMMMMIPEPWVGHESMSAERKAFYEYHSCLMEPWDGPASVAFTDGVQIGACLDRNGLRPSRYYVTKDDLVVMASEVGVLDIAPERVLSKGRLQPGRMFLIDTALGRIVADDEIKDAMAKAHPYGQWLTENMVELATLPEAPYLPEPNHHTVLQRQQAFGYSFEDLRVLMVPMARDGVEAIGSMGTDTPLAVLSSKPQVLYNYFKQLFAQVTNPPIDCIREEIVTSAETTIGCEGNLLNPQPASARLIELKSPVLSNEEFARLQHLKDPHFKSVTLPILFAAKGGAEALELAMDRLCDAASKAIVDGANIIILSDRGVNAEFAPIPALLAVSGVHHHLIRQGSRTRAGLVLESGEPREVHHFALLIGYGCGAINPYLAYETLDDMIRQGLLKGVDHKTAVKNFSKAATKGVVKTISKMGISTIQSYRGAQIFEAIGLSNDLVDKYFTWTPSRVGGLDLATLTEEILRRHQHAYPPIETNGTTLEAGGQYQWRADGELHLFNPQTVHKLQKAVRNNDYKTFKEYSGLVDNQLKDLYTLRGLLEFQSTQSIPLEEVEPMESILRRFKSGAMSYGSISKEAHEALAIAMNRVGGRSNTGEGGEDPERFHWTNEQGDSKNSAIKQVASGRFGVTSDYLSSAKEIQIKMAQGAKPGEGGQLPGTKVYPWIAKTRHSTPGVGLISPPPHHDIYSIEDLAELIHDLKNSNRAARVSVKLVSEVGVGTIAAGVAKAHADVVLISGYDGGTGASPQSSIKHAGIPWELGLAETHQTLLLNNLRSRIVVETDGQLKTGRDVAIAALLGAEEFGFATAPLVSLGCIMMRVCHLNTCPVGVATQDPKLRAKFTGDPAHAVNFMRFIAMELREWMAKLGFRTINEMVGRVDVLEARKAVDHWKAKGLDLGAILHKPELPEGVGQYCQMQQDHGLDKSLDLNILLDIAKPALLRKEKVIVELPIRNTNRVVGTILGNELTKKHGPAGLPEDTIQLRFKGSAGQSLGAFMPPGITIRLEGDANDYCGKGLSGGKVIIAPPAGATFKAGENIIIGNVALYGATSGEAYFCGQAGERFGVRNSGAHTVVEGVGDHACEYMTGGTVIVLGPTGRNFAAGMSGGIAYVLDEMGDFARRCNTQMVGLTAITDDQEAATVRRLIERHVEYTGSERGRQVLADWPVTRAKFVKVMPKDYQRVLQSLEKAKAAGLSGDEAVNAAFEENSRDASRLGGG